MRVQDILKNPVVTEKALDAGKRNAYVFDVHPLANKSQIQEAVETLFNVEVDTIKTLIRKGKVRRVGRKMKTKKLPDIKKAIITLKKGSIDLVPKA